MKQAQFSAYLMLQVTKMLKRYSFWLLRKVAEGSQKERILQYILITAVNQEDLHKFCNILVDKEKKCGKIVIWLQTTKSLSFFNNSLRHQMGFILFDKLHFYLLYQLRSLVFRLIISWNFSLLSAYYCSSEHNGAVWAEQGPKLIRC